MRKLSYKLKLILAMAGLIVLVAASSLYFSTRSVEHHYSLLLQRQFRDLSANFVQDQKERLNRFAVNLNESTKNPRLVAALEIGHSDDYDRFYYDLANELSPILQRTQDPSGKNPPFFRFIDFEGTYLPPPPTLDSYLGIVAPVPEAVLKERFLPLATRPDQPAESKAGYLIFDEMPGGTLYEVWVLPTYDAPGFFMGDLVFVQAWNPGVFQQRGESVRSGLLLDRHFYGPPWKDLSHREIEKHLARKASGQTSPRSNQTLTAAGDEFAVYISPLETYPGFASVDQVTLFSLREERMVLQSIRQTLLSVSGIALAVGLIFSLIFGRQLSRRIKVLVEGTRAIADGNFTRKIPVRGRDEISDLGLAFNRMSDDLALKEKYRSVLEKVTDASVAEQLTAGQIKLGGEERVVTILFCDIRQFTPMSRTASASRIVEILNHHMTALTQVIHKHHGVVDKFVGDEIMALFGAPKSFGNDAQIAVACAQEMLETRARLNETSDPPVHIGIGIATGIVVAGCMGSEDRLNYTVIGNCVNLASRLCGQAPAGTCLLDEQTAACLEDIPLTESAPIQLKGFTNRIPVYTLGAGTTIASTP